MAFCIFAQNVEIAMKKYLSMIKFSHTIFALPFAILGFVLGLLKSEMTMDWILFLYVVLCMVFARSAAMAFNRYIDRDIDQSNPRTAQREIPSGAIKPRSALAFVLVNSLAFIAVTYFINPLCFYLSPVALAVILGYSLTKRFTFLCHLILGLGLGLAPIGAYLAVTGAFDWIPVLIGLGVLCWVSGFDIIYALQDEDFDQEEGLFSIPSFFGKKRALFISRFLHFCSSMALGGALYLVYLQLPSIMWLLLVAYMLFSGMLVFQQRLVSPTDLSRVGLAFFTTNGIASMAFSILVISALLFA